MLVFTDNTYNLYCPYQSAQRANYALKIIDVYDGFSMPIQQCDSGVHLEKKNSGNQVSRGGGGGEILARGGECPPPPT